MSHALAQTALLEEVGFEAANLLVKQVSGYFDETDDDISTDGRIGMLNAFAEGVVSRVF